MYSPNLHSFLTLWWAKLWWFSTEICELNLLEQNSVTQKKMLYAYSQYREPNHYLRVHEVLIYGNYQQSFTKSLRQTLIFMWISAPEEKFISVFQETFTSAAKIFISGAGLSALGNNSMKFEVFLIFSNFLRS